MAQHPFMKKTQMENQPAMKVGIIGIGQVGLVLMTNIHKANNTQFILSAVCDTRPEIGQLVPQGVTFTREAAEVVKSCDVIMTCLPRAQDVKTVWERSIKDNLSKGQYWIDHTSSIHSQNEQLDREVTCLGAQFIEAPITGGLSALKRGEMCCLVAGKRTAVDRMKSLLNINYQQLHYLGQQVGSCTVVKLWSNLLNASQIVAMTEMLLVAKRQGLDLNKVFHAIRASSGNSFAWETGVPEVFMGRYDTSFTIQNHNKDIANGVQLADDLGVDIPMMKLTQQKFKDAQNAFGDLAGCYSYAKLAEDLHEEKLQVAGYEKWSWGIEVIGEEQTSAIRHENCVLPE